MAVRARARRDGNTHAGGNKINYTRLRGVQTAAAVRDGRRAAGGGGGECGARVCSSVGAAVEARASGVGRRQMLRTIAAREFST